MAPVGTFGFNLPFGHPAISEGTVAFRAAYLSGVGIFIGNGGPLSTIVKTGDPAPSGTFTDLGSPSISGDIVAFGGEYSAGAGIFIGGGGPLMAIVEEGDAAPLETFTSVGTPSISGTQVAFVGTYGSFTHRGIFVGNGGPLSTVIKTGDSLFGSTVVGVSFGRFGLDAGGSGNLAFLYQLADGQFGVAAALTVPEPRAFALFGLGTTILSLAAKARRKGKPGYSCAFKSRQ